MEENKNEEVLEQTKEQQEENPKKKSSKKNKIDISKEPAFIELQEENANY